MLVSAIIFTAALAGSAVLTPVVRALALRFGVVDVPDGGRHRHGRPVPRMGGVAVGLAALGATLAYLVLTGLASADAGSMYITIVVGGVAVLGIGVLDDVRGLRAPSKLLLQTVVAVAVVMAGGRFDGGAFLGGSGPLPVWASAALTVFWIVGITNAFNLLDGSDGVTTGAALLAALAMAAASSIGGDGPGVVLGVALAGGALGFLFFNFPPASIFLGDAGSLFLGYALAALGVMVAKGAAGTMGVLIPVVAFGLPILDTMLAMARRFLRRDPIFRADHGHIHHRLRDLGLSPRQVAITLYAVCAALAAASLLLIVPAAGWVAGSVLIIVGAAALLLVHQLRIPELLEFGRIVGRGLRHRSMVANNLRIRRAAARIREADDAWGVMNALSSAFDSGEFLRVEVWVDESVADLSELVNRQVVANGRGYLWSRGADILRIQGAWEIRVPYREDGDRITGYIALWKDVAESDHLLTDVRLIALELQPEVHRAFTRLRERELQTALRAPRRADLIGARG